MATRVLSPQKQREITEYFPPSPQHFPEDLDDDLDVCKGTDFVDGYESKTPPLLTPETTPTKETDRKHKCSRDKTKHHVKELLGETCDRKSESSSDSETKENKSTRQNGTIQGCDAVKQESVSPADSPRPTQAKVTRNDTSVETAKGRSGRRRGRGRRKPAETTNTANTTTRKNSSSGPSQRKPTNIKAAESNMKVTDYFPVRRSNRRTAADLKKEQQSDLERLVNSKCEDGLKVVELDGKGRGVIATKEFKRGDFVVEYVGDLIDLSTAKNRETKYSRCSSIGCYMYYFEHNNKNYCIDATSESIYLGRLLNHSCRSNVLNCQTKVVSFGGNPHLILVAARDIKQGEELLYDYGDRNKESLAAHPWLAS